MEDKMEEIKSKEEIEYLTGKKLTVEVIFKVSSNLLVGEEIIIKPPESSKLLQQTLKPLSEDLAALLLNALDAALGISGILEFKKEVETLRKKIWPEKIWTEKEQEAATEI
jgi:hypothetical protein